MKIKFTAGIIALLGFATICAAGGRLEFQSTCLGDGWFRYHLSKPNSPSFWSVDPGTFFTAFTNRLDYGPDPEGWTNVVTDPANYAQWNYTSNPSLQPRFYECDFLVHSAERAFRTTSNAFAIVSVRLVSPWFNYVQAGGYIPFPSLTPCEPSSADASATNLTWGIDVGDDLVINHLVVTSNSILGIAFNWSRQCTVLLQGSTDAVHWTNAALIWGNAGDTVWTTNKPLNDLGNFFRLELVAVNQHLTNLPSYSAKSTPLSSLRYKTDATTTDQNDPSPSLTFSLSGNEVVVQFVSEQGREYAVQANDRSGQVVATERTLGTGKTGEVRFKSAGLPNPVFFTVKPSL